MEMLDDLFSIDLCDKKQCITLGRQIATHDMRYEELLKVLTGQVFGQLAVPYREYYLTQLDLIHVAILKHIFSEGLLERSKRDLQALESARSTGQKGGVFQFPNSPKSLKGSLDFIGNRSAFSSRNDKPISQNRHASGATLLEPMNYLEMRRPAGPGFVQNNIPEPPKLVVPALNSKGMTNESFNPGLFNKHAKRHSDPPKLAIPPSKGLNNSGLHAGLFNNPPNNKVPEPPRLDPPKLNAPSKPSKKTGVHARRFSHDPTGQHSPKRKHIKQDSTVPKVPTIPKPIKNMEKEPPKEKPKSKPRKRKRARKPPADFLASRKLEERIDCINDRINGLTEKFDTLDSMEDSQFSQQIAAVQENMANQSNRVLGDKTEETSPLPEQSRNTKTFELRSLNSTQLTPEIKQDSLGFEVAMKMQKLLKRIILSTSFSSLRSYRRPRKRKQGKTQSKIVILQTAIRRYVKVANLNILKWAVETISKNVRRYQVQ